ncbi:hypothetical protein Y032_0243g3467 [Ancylostoma ceylanicum]|uniref:Uncharacterized protein n=1 Tax=Ancylostoma ceylanicum TaxID=53326 RepID=A0A016SE24_9BILA|nr:hypothetical protein Y032_0243g3467 [Ancylostoma ceylanicum]
MPRCSSSTYISFNHSPTLIFAAFYKKDNIPDKLFHDVQQTVFDVLLLPFWARIHERETKPNQVSELTFMSCVSQHYIVYGLTNHASRRWFAWLAFHES